MTALGTRPVRLFQKHTLLVCAFLCSAVVALATFFAPIRSPYRSSDLVVYKTTVDVVRSGENPYDPAVMIARYRSSVGVETTEPGMMWNPPVSFIFPGALLLPPAEVIYQLLPFLSVLSAFALAAIGWRLSGGRTALSARSAILSCCSFPLLVQLSISQISSIVALPALYGALLFIRGTTLRAGMLLALAIIKPHVLFLPMLAIAFWSIVNRRWLDSLGGLLGLVLGFSLAELVYPNSLQQWADRSTWPVNLAGAAIPTLLRWYVVDKGGSDPIYLEVLLPAIGGLGFLLHLWRSCRQPTGSAFIWAMILNSFCTPYGYTFDQSVNVVAQAFILAEAGRRSARALGVRWILLANIIPCVCFIAIPHILPVWWMSYPVVLTVGMWVVTRRRPANLHIA